ncbi:spermidine synthase domain protein [Mycobacterium kansasii]|uniref:Spermidine synthase domain protein n=1 Tax=Mycobacterium kansasii TaxID=1768 RepID=A0A1V3W9A9_MYCKA|nr:spermidine synthase domain protein [Mycobacterium kansasii]
MCPRSVTGASSWHAAGPAPRADGAERRAVAAFPQSAGARCGHGVPGDVAPRPLEPSTLDNPRIVEDMRHGYD